MVSYFKSITDNRPVRDYELPEILNMIGAGTWQDLTAQIRAEKDKKQRQLLKKRLPYFTPSGRFSVRRKDDIIKHSGFISIDFDDVEDIPKAKEILKNDIYTHAVFVSVSGNGLCAIVRIEPERHLDAFLALETYYANNYELLVDRACKDITRARIVSYDKDMYQNQSSAIFKKYLPKKQTKKKKIIPTVTTEKDIEHIVQQISNSSVNITESYKDWLECGFALAAEFGEAGRQYFHGISSNSLKYDEKKTDRQYDACLKSSGDGVTIGTLIYHAKKAGIETTRPETRHAVTVAKMAKSHGRGMHEAVKTLVEYDGMEEKEATEIVEKAYEMPTSKIEGENKTAMCEEWLRIGFDIRRNSISRKIEVDGVELDDIMLNSLHNRYKKEVDETFNKSAFDQLIFSDFAEAYDPIQEYFDELPLLNEDELFELDINNSGLIEKLASAIESPIKTVNGKTYDYKNQAVFSWMVGAVASAYGEHSPLLLVLTGGQNTGKTEFFRRLLPAQLKPYYAESKLDAGKDDEILMTQKLIILDDEWGGKSKNESKRIKELTSKETFSLREPYGRANVTLKRLAVLAGTCNELEVLNDPTGNRRILPLEVLSINHEVYNSIDKQALWAEAVSCYKANCNWRLTKEFIKELGEATQDYQIASIENELITKLYSLPKKGQTTVFKTTTDIKIEMEEHSNQRTNINKIGAEMRALGFVRKSKYYNGVSRKGYEVVLSVDAVNDPPTF